MLGVRVNTVKMRKTYCHDRTSKTSLRAHRTVPRLTLEFVAPSEARRQLATLRWKRMPATLSLPRHMESPIHIVPAAQQDYEWCARLMVSTEPWITLKRDLDGCLATVTRPGTDLFLARDDQGRPLGFILLSPYGFAASPYIACFAIAEDARGRGIGSQFIQFTEQLYRDRGHIFLLVSSFNHRAQQFYQDSGFQFIGELKDYIVPGHSELIFHKRIPSRHP